MSDGRSETANVECGHDVCLDIGRGCRFVGSARLCPHPAAQRDVYRNNGRLFTFCRACDSDLSFHDLRSNSGQPAHSGNPRPVSS